MTGQNYRKRRDLAKYSHAFVSVRLGVLNPKPMLRMGCRHCGHTGGGPRYSERLAVCLQSMQT